MLFTNFKTPIKAVIATAATDRLCSGSARDGRNIRIECKDSTVNCDRTKFPLFDKSIPSFNAVIPLVGVSYVPCARIRIANVVPVALGRLGRSRVDLRALPS
jgi:hypothetical protein